MDNELCLKFEGPSMTGAIDIMACDKAIEGQNVFLTFYEPITDQVGLNMEEVILIGSY